MHSSKASFLFDRLVRKCEQRRWDFEAERLGGLEVDHELARPNRTKAEKGKTGQLTTGSKGRLRSRATSDAFLGLVTPWETDRIAECPRRF
jgi:hypothetical protein